MEHLARKHRDSWGAFDSDPINEIDEGAVHSVEHSPRFLLRALKRSPDATPYCAVVGVLVLVAIIHHVIHPRAGKHSLGTRYVPLICADVNRADRPRSFALQGHDPGRIAAFIRS